jgi:hypothetical protein
MYALYSQHNSTQLRNYTAWLGPAAKFRCRFPAAAFFTLFGVGEFRCRAFYGEFISSTLSY